MLLLDELKAEVTKIEQEIISVVERDKVLIIDELKKGVNILHEELASLHVYLAHIKALIQQIEARIGL